MNREIEFRGKRKDNNEWVYGSLVYDVNRKWYIHPNNCSHVTFYYEVIPETIGQYTGLVDKNGKKIFEGDIVKVHYTYESYDPETLGAYEKDADIQGIVSLTTSLGIYIDTGDECQNYIWVYLSDCPLPDFPEQIEVIGNIYENNLESKGE